MAPKELEVQMEAQMDMVDVRGGDKHRSDGVMDDHMLSPGPGKTAPRLINDLLDYDPRYLRSNGRNLLAGAAPRFKGAPILRKGPLDCRHTLMKKVAQTNAPLSNDEQPDEATKYVVASYCSTCRYHFQITVDFLQREDGQVPCRLSDAANPMHHLRLVESTDSKALLEKHELNKYDKLTEAHRFVCSGTTCPVVVEIKISPPRLSKKMLSLIMDPAKVNARGRRVIAEEPDRYAGFAPLLPLQALGNLRQYLLDAKAAKDPSELKRIAKRNKKFVLAFADECDSLFNYLDFTPIRDDGPEPDDEPSYFWQLPAITKVNRNFIDDILMEIDLKIAERPADEQRNLKVNVIHAPLPALKDIERSLGYFDYDTRSRTVDLATEEHPYYSSLGCVDNFTDDLLSWAYERQCQCDPANKPYYLDCLADLAKGRGSSDLELKVVMATSAGEYGLKEIEEAYKFFALDPATEEGDDHIMGVYNSRIEAAPRQKDEARQCLRVIARARNSEKIEVLANDQTMSFEEALEFLSVTGDTASDSIEAAAVAMALDSDKSRVARALRVIANRRGNDYTLQRAASNMESENGEPKLDIGEAYNRLQIVDRNAPDETVLAYYQSLSSGAPAGSKDSFTEALRVIAYDRQSNFLLRKLDDPNADVQAARSTADEPVGLDNIGNTCYLNSLLQYYYTIKPFRDVVMNIDSYRMDLNDENIGVAISKKRVTGQAVTRADVIKAQKFVDELRNLFENLRTASTRSVKPTKQLAKWSIFSEEKEAMFRKASISSPNGPPSLASILNGPVYGPEGPPPPPVPSRPTPTPEEDIEMVDRPSDKPLEDGDDSSEATLVDMEPEAELPPPYNESMGGQLFPKEKNTERDELSRDGIAENTVQGDDAVMINGETLSSESEVPEAPEKRPPVPPRNKVGLSIQTNDTKDINFEDGLWKFGSQQDVTEVIGNVVWRLQCAIKPTSIDEDGTQIDQIRDTFFGATAVYSQKSRKLEKKVESWANLMVYPDRNGSRDIYEALDVVYDEQIVEIGKSMIPQYFSITKLPPILQIQIQRTAYDKDTHIGWKNSNPVIFPETIYLDRYMDSDDPNSSLMQRRRQAWRWKAQLRTLQAREAALKATEAALSVPEALLETKYFINTLQEEEIPGLDIDPSLADALEERIAEVAEELELIDHRINILKQKLTEQFTNMREYEYKLQTVFIHRGESGSGHYWIYVYDFENDIWREYNDEYVSVVKDRRRIFEHKGVSSGTPYYLAYVRSADRKDLVNAVFRNVKEVEMTDVTDSWDGQMDGQMDDEAIAMENDEENGDVRHIEHVKPRTLLPRPAAQSASSTGWGSDWVGEGSSLDANGKKW